MEIIKEKDQIELKNPGVISKQLLSPHNSSSKKVTITNVTVSPGCIQPRHNHETSEQIWTALEGSSKLLIKDEKEISFVAGDVVRFEDGDIHGLRNDSNVDFVYISVTSPPINFNYAYREEK